MPDANYWKSEMDVTYREIQEVKDKLRDLEKEEHYAWKHAEALLKASQKALAEKNLPEHEEKRQAFREASNYRSTLLNQISDLKMRKQALWDQHNQAIAEWRRLRGQ
jgi:hypothetical protein